MEELPLGWEEVSLREVTSSIQYGYTAPASSKNTGTRLLRITDIQNGFVNWPTVPFCECPDPSKYLLESNDLVVARTGATTGKSYLIENVTEPSVFASYLIRVRTSATLLPKYLSYYFKTEDYWSQIRSASKGSAQPGVNASLLSNLKVPVSPLSEQERIIEKLDCLMARSSRARNELERISKLVERYKQAVLAAAFSGELTADWRNHHQVTECGEALVNRLMLERRARWEVSERKRLNVAGKEHKGDSWRNRYKEPEKKDWTPNVEIPSSWCWVSVDTLADCVQYGSSAKTSESFNGVPVFRMGNIFEGKLLLDNLKYLPFDHDEFPELLLDRGDILFNRTNSADLVGKTAVYQGDPSPASFASYLIRLKVHGVRPLLLAAYINSSYGRSWIRSVVNQQVGQANVNGTKLRQLGFPLMPEDEQIELEKRINDRFAAIDASTQDSVKALELLGRLEQQVLAKAFRGDLVPQDPNDEPFSVLLERVREGRTSLPSKKKTMRKEGEVTISSEKPQATLW